MLAIHDENFCRSQFLCRIQSPRIATRREINTSHDAAGVQRLHAQTAGWTKRLAYVQICTGQRFFSNSAEPEDRIQFHRRGCF